MGYTKWDNFLTVIAKAKAACSQAGHGCDDHFAGVGKMVHLGSGAEREIEDIALSRYASYRLRGCHHTVLEAVELSEDILSEMRPIADEHPVAEADLVILVGLLDEGCGPSAPAAW